MGFDFYNKLYKQDSSPPNCPSTKASSTLFNLDIVFFLDIPIFFIKIKEKLVKNLWKKQNMGKMKLNFYFFLFFFRFSLFLFWCSFFNSGIPLGSNVVSYSCFWIFCKSYQSQKYQTLAVRSCYFLYRVSKK